MSASCRSIYNAKRCAAQSMRRTTAGTPSVVSLLLQQQFKNSSEAWFRSSSYYSTDSTGPTDADSVTNIFNMSSKSAIFNNKNSSTNKKGGGPHDHGGHFRSSPRPVHEDQHPYYYTNYSYSKIQHNRIHWFTTKSSASSGGENNENTTIQLPEEAELRSRPPDTGGEDTSSQRKPPSSFRGFFNDSTTDGTGVGDQTNMGIHNSAEEIPPIKTGSKDSQPNNSTSSTTTTSSTTNVEQLEFQAETRQLLDIVTHSLYTDREVFLRELISNASDALEKLRLVQASGGMITSSTEIMSTTTPSASSSTVPLEIRITLDEVQSTISITDTGIGMTREEMVRNLGTIARSGTKHFIEQMKSAAGGGATDSAKTGGSSSSSTPHGIIGKFGVGFYSAFMVSDRVEVRSRSSIEQESPSQVWTSDGSGTYTIADLDDENIRQDRGTSIILYLKDTYWEYIDENRIKTILQKYSNFVNFPIYLNGTRVNTISALWSQDPKQVQYEDYVDFYKYIANAVDDPLDIYHFRTDAPLDIKALFFIPSFHTEKHGMARMEPGVSLYSQKVLIEAKSPNILPDWLRFVKGVVDSEDLPLVISREKTQDSALLTKLRRTLTRKFLTHMSKMLTDDKSKYLNEFYREYSHFLKEGICQDYEYQSQLSKLLFFDTSRNVDTADLVSLDEYVGRMKPEQAQEIYYLVAPTRQVALNSPYLEAFTKAGVEVLFLFGGAIDDFVMANLDEYEGRKLVSVERSNIDLSTLKKTGEKDSTENKADNDKAQDNTSDSLYKADRELTDKEAQDLCQWFITAVGTNRVESCTVTKRLVSSPAIITDHESGAVRRMMRYVDTTAGTRDTIPLPKQLVEINPSHPVMVGMYELSTSEPTLARVLAEQIFDNCLVAAGLLDDSRSMLPRLNDLLICVVNGAKEIHRQRQQTDSASTTGE